ncbi:hypothetical protein [Ureibacillus chungkukjangi]|uniref:Uncharacterized protein n=1 Tax=Ureibacillus chungkukjangi TaxID=1202712 RepID=A0A318U5S5_9BACL|nr:hypothetical protein [Ureibacillus chungkukjangi]PYF07269.1 hypothetical protein BJ095_10559 [Ureibacillus chungkukjangi]
MSYAHLLLVCLLMIGSIALVMYYLGTKISYNYILYNGSVSIGSGVVFFVFKILLTMGKVGPIEQVLDVVITLLLLTVWLVILIETFTVEVMENGREIKASIISMVKWIKMVEIKTLPQQIIQKINIISVKTKNYMVKNKLTIKIQKLIGEQIKQRELNKRV